MLKMRVRMQDRIIYTKSYLGTHLNMASGTISKCRLTKKSPALASGFFKAKM